MFHVIKTIFRAVTIALSSCKRIRDASRYTSKKISLVSVSAMLVDTHQKKYRSSFYS